MKEELETLRVMLNDMAQSIHGLMNKTAVISGACEVAEDDANLMPITHKMMHLAIQACVEFASLLHCMVGMIHQTLEAIERLTKEIDDEERS